MPKINPQTSDRVEKAFFLHKKHPQLTVPQLMNFSNFSKREQEDRAIKMCIYRRIKKFALYTDKFYLSPPNTVLCIAENGTLSSATEANCTPPQETLVKHVRMTAYAAQTLRQAQNQIRQDTRLPSSMPLQFIQERKQRKVACWHEMFLL